MKSSKQMSPKKGVTGKKDTIGVKPAKPMQPKKVKK